ncbi:MAG: nucleotidyltransferase [Bacteroidia bacterium]
MSLFDPDGLSFLSALHTNKVRFMLVGGIAVNYYGHSRATGDIDLWVEDSLSNRHNLVSALKDYGIEQAEIFLTLPLLAGYSEVLLNSGVYIDLMSELQFFKKDSFFECYELAEVFEVDQIDLKVLHINRLIEEKKKSSRSKDRDDAEMLEAILRKRKV